MRPLVLFLALILLILPACKSESEAPPVELAGSYFGCSNDGRWSVQVATPVEIQVTDATTGAVTTVGPGCASVSLHQCWTEADTPWPLQVKLSAPDGACWYAYSAGVPDADCDELANDYLAFTSACPS